MLSWAWGRAATGAGGRCLQPVLASSNVGLGDQATRWLLCRAGVVGVATPLDAGRDGKLCGHVGFKSWKDGESWSGAEAFQAAYWPAMHPACICVCTYTHA